MLCRDTGKETGGYFGKKENVQAFLLQGFGFRVLTISSSFGTRPRILDLGSHCSCLQDFQHWALMSIKTTYYVFQRSIAKSRGAPHRLDKDCHPYCGYSPARDYTKERIKRDQPVQILAVYVSLPSWPLCAPNKCVYTHIHTYIYICILFYDASWCQGDPGYTLLMEKVLHYPGCPK